MSLGDHCLPTTLTVTDGDTLPGSVSKPCGLGGGKAGLGADLSVGGGGSPQAHIPLPGSFTQAWVPRFGAKGFGGEK